MRTETLSYVKEHANHLVIDNPLLITQNGKARFVLQNVEDYESHQESLALLKLLILSEQAASQNSLTLEQAFAD